MTDTRWKPTHTGTCPGCGAKRALTSVGEIWRHHLKYPKRLPSGTLTAYVMCPGSHRQPRRGTRRPIEA